MKLCSEFLEESSWILLFTDDYQNISNLKNFWLKRSSHFLWSAPKYFVLMLHINSNKTKLKRKWPVIYFILVILLHLQGSSAINLIYLTETAQSVKHFTICDLYYWVLFREPQYFIHFSEHKLPPSHPFSCAWITEVILCLWFIFFLSFLWLFLLHSFSQAYL